MPRVSIIIPTHNRPHLLPRAVESAFAAGTEVEVVVVDDASTDETAAVCEALDRIRYVRLEQNQGVAGARNAGVLASDTEYIGLLDDDDVRLPGSIDLQLARLDNEPDAALIYGQAFINSTDLRSPDRYPRPCPSGDVFWQLLAQNFIPSGSVIFRRSCLPRTGLFDSSLPGIDDWDLWVRIASLYSVAVLDQPVMTWRQPSPDSDQRSASAVEMVQLCTLQFRRSWLKLPRAATAPETVKRKVSKQFSQNMANHLAWEAVRSLSYRKLFRANRCLFAAIRLHPRALASRAWLELFGRRGATSI